MELKRNVNLIIRILNQTVGKILSFISKGSNMPIF